jgi:hypothetical protein
LLGIVRISPVFVRTVSHVRILQIHRIS